MRPAFFVALLGVVVAGSVAHAVPTISGVSGQVGFGEQITISGSNFGAGPNVILFDDFASGTAGQVHTKQAVVGTWATTKGIIFSDPKLSNGQGMRVVGSPGQLTSVVTFPTTDKVFISFAGYVPDGYKFPSAAEEQKFPTVSALKAAWLMYDSDGYNKSTKPDHVLTAWTGGTFYTVASNDSGGPSQFDMNGDVAWQWDTPSRWSFWAKGNGTSRVGSDGFFMATNGSRRVYRSYKDYKPWFTTTHTVKAWNRVNFVGYVRSATSFADGNNFVLDDIYVATGDSAQARVEIGNAPTYSQCTKLTFVTTGAAGDNWSSSSITATIRQGAFSQSELANAYLYVIGADGSVNLQGWSLEALAAPIYMPGDANHDLRIDGADLAVLGLNWNPSPSGLTWEQGDFNGDGAVDGGDLALLGLNWSPDGYSQAALAPEPASLLVLAGGLVAAMRRRPAKRSR